MLRKFVKEEMALSKKKENTQVMDTALYYLQRPPIDKVYKFFNCAYISDILQIKIVINKNNPLLSLKRPRKPSFSEKEKKKVASSDKNSDRSVKKATKDIKGKK